MKTDSDKTSQLFILVSPLRACKYLSCIVYYQEPYSSYVLQIIIQVDNIT